MSVGNMVLIRLRAEIESELELILLLQNDLDECAKVGNTGVILRAKASVYHDFYTGIEHIFTRIASELNGGVPNTQQWHTDLLQDMVLSLDDIRPAVISSEMRDSLFPFLRFRHLFRNLYGFNLDPKRLEELDTAFPKVLSAFRQEIGVFITWLHETGSLSESESSTP